MSLAAVVQFLLFVYCYSFSLAVADAVRYLECVVVYIENVAYRPYIARIYVRRVI